jgi:hypothetical protein
MNIVTSVGYGDMFGTTDTERISTAFIIITGDALFAVAFGLIATIAASKESPFSRYINMSKEMKRFCSLVNMPPNLTKRIEDFYAYKWTMTEEYGVIDLNELYKDLPANMVKSIMHQCYDNLIGKISILTFDESSTVIVKLIATKLKPKICLPHDTICISGTDA